MFKFTEEVKKRYDEKWKDFNRKFGDSIKKGSVYFIAELEPHKDKKNYYSPFKYIKIGYSTNLQSRLSSLQTSNARELIVLGCLNNMDSSSEKMIHDLLDESIPEARQMGEWFRYDLVRKYLGMWISSSDYYYYDIDQDLLGMSYRYLKFQNRSGEMTVYHNLEKNRRFDEIDGEKAEWLEKNSWFGDNPFKTARKNYIDEFGDLITAGSEYYQVKYGVGYSDYYRLSCRSANKLVKVIFDSGIKTNIENLKYYYKEFYGDKNELIKAPNGMHPDTFFYLNKSLKECTNVASK